MSDITAKSSFEMKAEDLTKRKVSQWLDGAISRRILVLPFGGPLPGGKAGLDLDGECFDETTDIYGPYPALKASPWRVMDWHHDDFAVPGKSQGGPALSMKGTTIGEIEFEDEPDDFGHWANWWIRRGQSNEQMLAVRRVAALEQMGQPLFGSSYALYKRKASSGLITEWPIIRHTASTAPRNPLAVIPPLKALLGELTSAELTSGALKALLVGLSELEPDLAQTFSDGVADSSPVVSGDVPATEPLDPLPPRVALEPIIDRVVTELVSFVGAKEGLNTEDLT